MANGEDDAGVEAAAEELVARAHHGQVDKQGRDYVEHHLHPIAESLRPFGRSAYVAGLLHDVVEDTDTTYAQLSELGFSDVVVAAVRSVTRQEGETYDALIERAAADPLGRLVKLADNWHNLSSLDSLADEADRDRLRERYRRARIVLERSLAGSPSLHLFSFGTLQDPTVQQGVFGRELPGSPDVLRGYRLGVLRITDPEVIRLSGLSEHPLLMPSSDPADEVQGQVLSITAPDLAAADEYEVDDYARTEVTLASGTVAWVYLDKSYLSDPARSLGP